MATFLSNSTNRLIYEIIRQVLALPYRALSDPFDPNESIERTEGVGDAALVLLPLTGEYNKLKKCF